MAMHAGDIIEGRYRLDEPIGHGGMGEVWRAQDTTLDRPVAIKILSDRTVDEEDKRSFFREARLAAAVRHRNVALVLDFGTRGDGSPFIVMELLEGENLGDVFFRQGRLSFEEIVDIMVGALSGLAAAHDVGIVHRDLKPENIFLARDRDSLTPKLLDFGISKSLDAQRPSPVVTQADRVVGTPAYMSPEQARGLKNIDHRSDLYSMGVILFEALAGEPPFFDENPGDLMVQIITAPTPRLDERVPGLPKGLADFVERAMSRLPEDRYQSGDAMRADLEHLAQHIVSEDDKRRLQARQLPRSWRETQALTSRTGHAPGRPRTAAKDHAHQGRTGLLLVTAAVLTLSGGAGLFWWSSRDAPEPYVIKVQQPTPTSEEPAEPSSRAEPAKEPEAGDPSLDEPDEKGEEPRTPESKPRRKPAAKARRRAAARPVSHEGRSVADTLSTRFQRQKSGVVRCLQASDDATAYGSMAIRFTIDKQGKVVHATVLPPALANTETGRCMRRAAEAMRFGAQANQITFRIPLKTRTAG